MQTQEQSPSQQGQINSRKDQQDIQLDPEPRNLGSIAADAESTVLIVEPLEDYASMGFNLNQQSTLNLTQHRHLHHQKICHTHNMQILNENRRSMQRESHVLKKAGSVSNEKTVQSHFMNSATQLANPNNRSEHYGNINNLHQQYSPAIAPQRSAQPIATQHNYQISPNQGPIPHRAPNQGPIPHRAPNQGPIPHRPLNQGISQSFVRRNPDPPSIPKPRSIIVNQSHSELNLSKISVANSNLVKNVSFRVSPSHSVSSHGHSSNSPVTHYLSRPLNIPSIPNNPRLHQQNHHLYGQVNPQTHPQMYLQQSHRKYSQHNSPNSSKPARPPRIKFAYNDRQPETSHPSVVSPVRTAAESPNNVAIIEEHAVLIEKLDSLHVSFHSFENQYSNLRQIIESESAPEQIEELRAKNRLLEEKVKNLQLKMSQICLNTQSFHRRLFSFGVGSISRTQSEIKPISQYQSLIKYLRSKIAEYSKEYARLDQQYHSLESRYVEQHQELCKSEQTSAQLQEYVEKMETENQRIMLQIENLQQRLGSIEGSAGDLESANIKKQFDAQSKYSSLGQQQIEDIISTQDNLINELENQIRKFTDKVEHNSQLQQKFHSQSQYIAKLEGECQQLQSDYQQLNKQSEQSIQQLKAELRNVEVEMQDKENRKRDHESSQRNATQLESRHQAELESLRSQNLQLSSQIMEMEKESKKNREEMENQLEERLHEIKESIGNQSRDQAAQSQRKSNRIISEYENMVNQLKKEIKDKHEQNRQIYNNMEQALSQKDNELSVYASRLARVIEQKEHILASKNRSIESLQNRMEELQLEIKRVQENSLQPIREMIGQDDNSGNNSTIATLELECKRLSKQVDQKILQNNQLRRQLSLALNQENQLQMLTESINKKNEEIIELKKIKFEYQEVCSELETVRNERDRMKINSDKKSKLIEELSERVDQLENQSDATKQVPNRHSAVTIQQQHLQMGSMDSKIVEQGFEIRKLTQRLGLITQNNEELELEIEKWKKLYEQQAKEVSLQVEQAKMMWENNKKEEISGLLQRIRQQEQIIQEQSETDRNTQIQHNRKLEEMQAVIEERQRQTTLAEVENQQLKNSITKYKDQNQSLIRKTKQMESDSMGFADKISRSESSSKISNLETKLTDKEKQMKTLEGIIEELKRSRTGHSSEDLYIKNQQISVLKKKLEDCESRSKARHQSKASLTPTFGCIHSEQALPISEHENAPAYRFLRRRLEDLNNKIRSLIRMNSQWETGSYIRQTHQPHPEKSVKNEKTYLLRRHENELISLQSYIIQLLKYLTVQSSISILPNQQYIYSQNSWKADDLTSIAKLPDTFNDDLEYYKQANLRLKERNDHLISMNKHLKRTIETNSQDRKNAEYYKNLAAKHEKQAISNYEKLARQGCETEGETIQALKEKIIDLQNTIHELNRKLAQSAMHNAILQADLNKNNSDASAAVHELQRFRNVQVDKDRIIHQLQHEIMKYKVSDSSAKATRYANQIAILEEQLQRLNLVLKNRHTDDEQQLEKYKQKVDRLQQQTSSLQRQLDRVKYEKSACEQKNNELSLLIDQKDSQMHHMELKTSEDYHQKCEGYQDRIQKLETELMQVNSQLSLSSQHREQEHQLFAELKSKHSELNSRYTAKCHDYDEIYIDLENMKVERQKEGDRNRQKMSEMSDMESNLQQLRKELQFYKKAYNENNSSVHGLRTEINLSELQLQKAKRQIQQISTTLKHNEANSINLRYRIESIRSICLEVEALVNQLSVADNSRQFRVKKSLHQIMFISLCDHSGLTFTGGFMAKHYIYLDSKKSYDIHIQTYYAM